MEDRGSKSGLVKMVRYCIHGHEIVYTAGEIVRNVCPYCKSPIDRTRPPIPYEEARRREKEEAAAQASTAEKAGGNEDEQKAQKKAPGTGTQRSIPGFRPATMPGRQQETSSSRFVRPGTFEPFKTDVSPAFSISRAEIGGLQHGEGSGFYFSLYGDLEEIPVQGVWIGREGLGKKWFDGNLMISRKHVFVRPDPRSGRLQINEDKSLNGVFYTGKNGKKVRMEGAGMMQPGDILWIYNIPLRLERH